MAVVHSTNALFLSLLLLCTSITIYADKASTASPPQSHHNHAPTPAPSHPPVKPPTHPPIKPPAHPPLKPPSHPPIKPPTASPPVKPPTPSYPPVKPPSYSPPRKLVAIRGMVYCNFCTYRGFDTLTNFLPVAGAVLKLQCNNTKIPLVEQTKSDAKGFFFFMPQKLTTFAWHKCKVSLVSSSLAWCGIPSNQNGGAAGATLIPTPLPPVNQTESKFMLFNVGPFAFEPPQKFSCK